MYAPSLVALTAISVVLTLESEHITRIWLSMLNCGHWGRCFQWELEQAHGVYRICDVNTKRNCPEYVKFTHLHAVA